MSYQGKLVIDADTHVFEPADRLMEYMDAAFRARVNEPMTKAQLNPQTVYNGNVLTFMPGQHSWKHPLGVGRAAESAKAKQTNAGETPFKPVWVRSPAGDCNVNPDSRVRDMDEEGADVAVIVPTAITGAAALAVELEQPLYQAYHRWLADFCGQHPTRLKGVMVACLRDVNGTVTEIRRVARENWCVGVMLGATPEDSLLDDPDLHPVWAAAQEADFALIQHAFTPRHPRFPGRGDMGENSFLAGICGMPFAAMRNTAALIGGGVFEKFQDLRYAILEADSGWFPAFMERADHQAKARHMSVPLLRSKPSEFLKGPRFFLGFGFEENGETLNYVTGALGEGHLVYGSDYCHPECHFPDSLKMFTGIKGVSEPRMREVLGEAAKRLYRRI